MYVNEDKIEKGQCTDHLGHRISINDNESMFMYDCGHKYSFVKSKLFKIYCCNFDGAPLWFLYGSAVKDVCVAWHKAL